MTHSSIGSQTQAGICIFDKIDVFFKKFNIASALHQCGVRKRSGHCVSSLIKTIFTLPFVGKNFFRGIVLNQELAFGKDAAYELFIGMFFMHH